MTALEVILLILLILSLSAGAWMAIKLYQVGLLVLDVQDTLEESLETLDNRADSIERILQIPLFSDSAEIKSIQRDMISCRDAILQIAYVLTGTLDKQAVETEAEEQS